MTSWSEYVSYFCRHPDCGEQCINRVHSPFAQTKQCRTCYRQHDPDDLVSLSRHLPTSSTDDSVASSSLD